MVSSAASLSPIPHGAPALGRLVVVIRIGVRYGGIVLASLFNTLAFGVRVFIVIVVARSQWCCRSHIPLERGGADHCVYENLCTSLGRGGVHVVGCERAGAARCVVVTAVAC